MIHLVVAALLSTVIAGAAAQTIVVNQGPYVSEYIYVTDGKNTTRAAGRQLCQDLGPGWDLGTFPTLQAKDAMFGLVRPTNRSWVGLSKRETSWVYSSGRLDGSVYSAPNGDACKQIYFDPFGLSQTEFYHQCLWPNGEPNVGLLGDPYNCAYIENGPVGELRALSCDGLVFGSFCERSPCKMGVDCHPDNTVNMTGSYYPQCSCQCKPGYAGARCESVYVELYPYVSEVRYVNQGPYVSEYIYVTDGRNTTRAAGRQLCQDLGPGWDLGTFPTLQAKDAMFGLVRPTNRSWVGLSKRESSWVYSSGRLDGSVYYTTPSGGACKQIYFDPFGLSQTEFYHQCLWPSGEPNVGLLGDPHNCAYIESGPVGELRALSCDGLVFGSFCERSPCKMGVDCHPDNTVNMTGSYYPQCSCQCKPGYEGARCEFKFVQVDQGPYVSEYRYLAIQQRATLDAGRQACKKMGDGWDLASMPTVQAQEAVTGLMPPNNQMYASGLGWIGVGWSGRGTQWIYTAGRLARQIYSSTLLQCDAITFNPFNLSATIFQHCWWLEGKPSFDGSDASRCASVLSRQTEGRVQNVVCDAALPGSVCERSPCKMGVDCHPDNTVNMTGSYYPNCNCQCKLPGYDASCEYPITSATSAVSSTSTVTATNTTNPSTTEPLTPDNNVGIPAKLTICVISLVTIFALCC